MENPVAVNTRVEQGRVGLVEGGDVGVVRDTLVPAEGWVSAVEGGLVVFTAAPNVEVSFRVQVLPEPPALDDEFSGAFEDVVELSYHARGGPGESVNPRWTQRDGLSWPRVDAG